VTEHNIGVFLVQMFVLLALARGVGELLRRRGYPALVGEISVGVLLGPTVLGRILPELQLAIFPQDVIQIAMLDTVAWFGVFFLLLETGLEINVSAAWRQRGHAFRVGIIGVLIPLAIGFSLSMLLPDRYLVDPSTRLPFALFLGTTIAISALVIIARVLHDLDLIKTDLGLVTLCGYAVNDVLAWIILSAVLGLASAEGISWLGISFSFGFSIVFTVFCLTWGIRWVDHGLTYLRDRNPDDHGLILSFVASLGLACGALTSRADLTALFGFFLAGIMAGQSRALTEQARHVIGQMVHAVFVPLYFAGLALRYDFVAEFDWFIVLFVTVVSIGAKFIGAYVGAWRAGMSRRDRRSIGIAFTPSGVTGIVVADVALELGILTPSVFVAIVVSVITSSILVSPLLSWSTDRSGGGSVLAFFQRDATLLDTDAVSRREVVEALCNRLHLPAETGLSRQDCAAAVCTREELAGTGVGHGVAFPHARIAGLRSPILLFGRSVRGVEWDAPDGHHVHLIFLLLSPDEDYGQQLQVLASLSKHCAEASFRDRLFSASSEEAVWRILQEAEGALVESSSQDRSEKGLGRKLNLG